jgi:hypothetical protein
MAYFDFSQLINKYASEFTAIIPGERTLNESGDYVRGEPIEKTMTGAIISMRERRIIRSEGAYTSQDRALYMLEPLPDALKKAKIIYDGNEYRVESELENSKFTGVFSYVLKFVSAFNSKGGADGG